MNSHRETCIRDEQLDSAGETPTRLPIPLHFGARAAVLAGVVATACATAAPALPAGASPGVSPAAAAAHVPATVTLHGPGAGLITPADSTCCM